MLLALVFSGCTVPALLYGPEPAPTPLFREPGRVRVALGAAPRLHQRDAARVVEMSLQSAGYVAFSLPYGVWAFGSASRPLIPEPFFRQTAWSAGVGGYRVLSPSVSVEGAIGLGRGTHSGSGSVLDEALLDQFLLLGLDTERFGYRARSSLGLAHATLGVDNGDGSQSALTLRVVDLSTSDVEVVRGPVTLGTSRALLVEPSLTYRRPVAPGLALTVTAGASWAARERGWRLFRRHQSFAALGLVSNF
jgi:hypothetical protein